MGKTSNQSFILAAAMPHEVAPLSLQSRAAPLASGTTNSTHDPESEKQLSVQPEAEQSTIENPDKKKTSIYAGLGWLDRLLVLWILLAIVIGILLGNFIDSVGPALQRGKFVDVSVPIAVGLLLMMYPILCKVQYETLHQVFAHRVIWVQLGFSIIVNWIIAPLLMLGLAWAFLPDKSGLRNGLIFVGLARCIAMVLIWTGLAGGDQQYCAILVAVNSLLQMVLYAPLAILFVNIITMEVAARSHMPSLRAAWASFLAFLWALPSSRDSLFVQSTRDGTNKPSSSGFRRGHSLDCSTPFWSCSHRKANRSSTKSSLSSEWPLLCSAISSSFSSLHC